MTAFANNSILDVCLDSKSCSEINWQSLMNCCIHFENWERDINLWSQTCCEDWKKVFVTAQKVNLKEYMTIKEHEEWWWGIVFTEWLSDESCLSFLSTGTIFDTPPANRISNRTEHKFRIYWVKLYYRNNHHESPSSKNIISKYELIVSFALVNCLHISPKEHVLKFQNFPNYFDLQYTLFL